MYYRQTEHRTKLQIHNKKIKTEISKKNRHCDNIPKLATKRRDIIVQGLPQQQAEMNLFL